jgi:hypothetical protein
MGSCLEQNGKSVSQDKGRRLPQFLPLESAVIYDRYERESPRLWGGLIILPPP